MTAADYLAAVAAREQAATDGPWSTYRDGPAASAWVVVGDGTDLYAEGSDPNASQPVCIIESDAHTLEWHQGDADAEFIAHARTDVPRLLAAVQAVLALSEKHIGAPCACDALAHSVRAAITDALEGR